MRKTPTKIAIAGLASTLLLGGCAKEELDSSRTTERVSVVMKGGLTRLTTRAIINPQDQYPNGGLPPQQLDINIITVNYTTNSPADAGTDVEGEGQPNLEAWSGQTADVTRGFFGENTVFTSTHNGNPIIPAGDRGEPNKPDNGRIEYTDEGGTSIQKVFYDENGEYYFVRLFYPYDNDENTEFETEFTSSTAGLGASIIFHNVDGSQDILCSNLGWGNIFNPLITTNDDDESEGEIVFSHMLSLFRIYIKPDNEVVVKGNPTALQDGGQYGKITGVQVVRQPSTLIADARSGNIQALNDPFETSYQANEFPTDGYFYLTGDDSGPIFAPHTVDAGYIIVYPGLNEYRIEVQTEKHKWVHGDLIFTNPPEPGKEYKITITLKEAYEMEIIETEVKDWWMDHVFN